MAYICRKSTFIFRSWFVQSDVRENKTDRLSHIVRKKCRVWEDGANSPLSTLIGFLVIVLTVVSNGKDPNLEFVTDRSCFNPKPLADSQTLQYSV